MKNIFFIRILISLALLQLPILTQTKVWAEEYEEISYDELVQRLNDKKNKVIQSQKGASVLDDIMIHVGLGFTTSSLRYENQGNISNQNINGFQLSLGIDLFTPEWKSEMTIRNLGGQGSSQEYSPIQSHREFDLRLLYTQSSSEAVPGFHIGGGLGSRYLKVSEVNNSFEEYSPTFMALAGLDYHFNKNFGVGAEVAFKSTIHNENHDRNSADLTIRLETSF